MIVWIVVFILTALHLGALALDEVWDETPSDYDSLYS